MLPFSEGGLTGTEEVSVGKWETLRKNRDAASRTAPRVRAMRNLP